MTQTLMANHDVLCVDVNVCDDIIFLSKTIPFKQRCVALLTINVSKSSLGCFLKRHRAVWLQKDYMRIAALCLWIDVTRQAPHVITLASGPNLVLSVVSYLPGD